MRLSKPSIVRRAGVVKRGERADSPSSAESLLESQATFRSWNLACDGNIVVRHQEGMAGVTGEGRVGSGLLVRCTWGWWLIIWETRFAYQVALDTFREETNR